MLLANSSFGLLHAQTQRFEQAERGVQIHLHAELEVVLGRATGHAREVKHVVDTAIETFLERGALADVGLGIAARAQVLRRAAARADRAPVIREATRPSMRSPLRSRATSAWPMKRFTADDQNPHGPARSLATTRSLPSMLPPWSVANFSSSLLDTSIERSDGNDFARVFAARGSSRGYRVRSAATSASRRLALNPKAMLPLIMTPAAGARGENAGINNARDDGVDPW